MFGIWSRTARCESTVLEIDLTHDLDAAIRGFEELERQVPFVMAQALVDTAFDVRRTIVGSTYPNAFEVKNKRFPGVMFKVMQDGAPFRGGPGGLARGLRATGEAEISVGDSLGRSGYMEVHTSGGVKKPRGATIAVPTTPSDVRGASGRVLKRNRPVTITKRKSHFLLKKGGRKVAIMKREGENLTAVYLFLPSANIDKSFRFYEDAERVALRVFSGHLDTRLARVMRVFSGRS